MILKLKPQFDKISVWLSDSRKVDAVAHTKQYIINNLKLSERDIDYMVFKEQKNKPAAPKKW